MAEERQLVRIDSRIGRAIQRVSASALFAKVGPPIVGPLDRLVHRLTKGRVMLSAMLVPALVLTTTGAKSGEPRTVPLAYFPEGDAIYLVGSNFGREQHPAWTANLRANPEATASFKGEKFRVRAHLLTPEEKDAVWPALTKKWPNYLVYTERSGRDLRVFRLERQT